MKRKKAQGLTRSRCDQIHRIRKSRRQGIGGLRNVKNRGGSINMATVGQLGERNRCGKSNHQIV
jgi:hypothetical protein